MVGFAEYTNTYETRLGRMPFYRKGSRGPDQLSTFASQKGQEYVVNAARIRDMRFAQSNEFNVDRAVRSQRERDISNAMDTSTDTRQLEGLRGRTSMKLSRTGGALSRYGKPGVVKGEAPMSLTVAGLASGDGVRAAQRVSASAQRAAEQSATAGFADYPNFAASDDDEEEASDDDSSISVSVRSVGRTTLEMLDSDTPRTLVPALQNESANSNQLPQSPTAPKHRPPAPPTRPTAHSGVSTFTSPTAGVSGVGAGAGGRGPPLPYISRTPTQREEYENAQELTQLLSQQRYDHIHQSPAGVSTFASSSRSTSTRRAVLPAIDSDIDFNARTTGAGSTPRTTRRRTKGNSVSPS